MKLIFIDEFSGRQNHSIFGLSFIVIDNNHYRGICEKFTKTIAALKWPEDKEFKGRFLFSGLSDEKTKSKIIESNETIDFVKNAVDFLSGDANSKCEIVAVYNEKGSGFENYCSLLGFGISKLKKLQETKKSFSMGKQNACLFYDGFTDGWTKTGINRIGDTASISLKERQYYLIEGRATPVDSHNHCVGVCYADILSHLICWKIETPNFDDEKQQTLFEPSEDSVQKKKIQVVREIIGLVKSKKLKICHQ